MSGDLSLREALFSMGEETYKAFHSKLIPNVDSALVIGVRTPKLRALAKEIAGTQQASLFMNALPHTYYEENNLHTLLIEHSMDFDLAIGQVEAFLPYIDNWATCDCLRPKIFKKHRQQLLERIKHWIVSEHPYTIRFGLEMLMVHFLAEDFSPEYLELAVGVHHDAYYVRMMVAWYFATALAEQYDAAVVYLQERRLDRWVHQKTIQKAIESYRISTEQKEYLRTLRD